MKHLLLTTIAAVVLVGCGNPEADRALIDATEAGDIESIKQHLAAGADVNATDEVGWTPLHHAIVFNEKNQMKIVELLIDKGADVNATDEVGRTPLHYASANGHKEVAELLISKGADLNAKDNNDGWIPLHYAVVNGQKVTAELLITKGADVNAKVESGSYKGMTPLGLVADDATAGLLRKHGGKTGEELKAEGK